MPETLMEEKFSCLLVDPAGMQTSWIEMTIEHDDLLEIMSLKVLPSIDVIMRLGHALLTGSTQGSAESLHILSTNAEACRPCFLIHNDIMVLSQKSVIAAAANENPARLELCPSHSITMRGRTIICGADRDNFLCHGIYRSMYRSLWELEMHWLTAHITWDAEGANELIPMSDPGTHDNLRAHILFESNDAPTPDLNDVLKKGA